MKSALIALTEFAYRILKGRSIEESLAFNPQKIAIIEETILVDAVIVFFIAAAALIIWKRKKVWFAKAALVLTIIELFIFSRGNLITAPIRITSKSNPVVEWLAANAGTDRFLSTSGNFPYTGLGVYWTHLVAREPFSPNQLTDEELETFASFKNELESVPENQGMQARLFDAAGYAAAVPETYLSFWQDPPTSPNAATIVDLFDLKLNIAGIKYIVTGYPEDYLADGFKDQFQLVHQAGNQRIYENKNAWPRAFFLEEAKTPAQILSYEPKEIVIRTNNKENKKLALTDTDYPGWIAEADGQRLPIETYEGVFRLIEVPAGTHEVKFLFKPRSVLLGAIISLTTLLSLVSSLLWQPRKKSQSSS